jgi:hypothetical protein
MGFGPIEISPGAFVEHHLKSLIDQNAECATCPGNRPAKDILNLNGRTLHTLVKE